MIQYSCKLGEPAEKSLGRLRDITGCRTTHSTPRSECQTKFERCLLCSIDVEIAIAVIAATAAEAPKASFVHKGIESHFIDESCS
jgi:hypothetical protein